MKKIIILLALVFCSTAFLKAQDANMFRFGLKVNPSVSWLKTDVSDFANEKSKINFSYGLIVERYFNQTTVLATGISITDFGSTLKYGAEPEQTFYFPDGDTTAFFLQNRKLKLKYVEVPLLLKFRTPEIGYMTYTAHFGLDFGFRVKSIAEDEGKWENTPTQVSTLENVDITDDVKFIKMALNVGLGAEYNLTGTTSAIFSLNYQNGFTNLLHDPSEFLNDHNASSLKQIGYGHAVVLTVGVLF